jgi:hypothetical protein
MLRLVLTLVWIAAVLPVTGNAAETVYYRYFTEKSVAYTDDLENVPERYRDSVEEVEPTSIHDYSRATHTERIADPMVRPAPEKPEAAPAPGVSTVTIEVGPGVFVDVPTGEGTEPVTVHKGWTRDDSEQVYPYTIVKQGDRILLDLRDDPSRDALNLD